MTGWTGSADPSGWSEPGRTTLEIKTGGWRTRRPEYVEGAAPCRLACPAGVPIARWIERARQGDHRGAWELVREENPFPAITGRVCAHPCESACNRREYDGAVAIQALERFIGDWGLAHGGREDIPVIRAEPVAVVGGGPAGLSCAYHLRRLGHRVHLFEADLRLGGLLRYGIPEYRLPRDVLDREIALAIGPGIEVFTGRRLGADLSWTSLARYPAVFLATGAPCALAPDAPGLAARGIEDGLAFLRSVNTGAARSPGSHVVVVGAGSTAMDVARSARRLGATSVTVLALEGRRDMPAQRDEIADAVAEGVEIMNGIGVSAFVEDAGRVTAVLASPAALERTPDGVIRPRFLGGASGMLRADIVLLAIGQAPDLSPLPPGIARQHGLVAVDADGRTSLGRVFAGGDLASARRTVTHALGAGARAARRIHGALTGRAVASRLDGPGWARPAPERVVEFAAINTAYFRPARPARRGGRAAAQRLRSFDETVGGLAAPVARDEMARCFACGHCVECDNCFMCCPDMAVSRLARGYRISAEHCKGCGLCVEECPRGALEMVSER